MSKRACLTGLLSTTLVLAHASAASAEAMDAALAFKKLTRGAVNIVTGWVELPKRVQETSDSSGAAAGFTWGLLRGLGYGFMRTAAGCYELLTFPFPAPPTYAPVIEPPYVFSEPGDAAVPPHP